MVDVTSDKDTIRNRVNVTNTEVPDADVVKYVVEAADWLGDQISGTIDETDCSTKHANAVRNLAALYCYFDGKGGADSWKVGEVSESHKGAPRMIKFYDRQVKAFILANEALAMGVGGTL